MPGAQLGRQGGEDLEPRRGDDRSEPELGRRPGSPDRNSASASSGVIPVSRVR